MAVMEQIETLMSDVGPVLDPLAIDAMPEAKCWGIAMEEDLSVLVEFDEQKNCLVLSSELGAPAPGAAAGRRGSAAPSRRRRRKGWRTTPSE